MKVYPILIPSQYRDKVPDLSGGVGTPRLVYDPELGLWRMFFTGWVNAASRSVFAADVEKDFTLSNLRKILSSPPTRDAVNALYDPWRDGYILSITEGGPLVLRYFDKNFNEVASKALLNGMQDSGAGVLTLMGGYSPKNPNAIIFYPRNREVKWRFLTRVDEPSELRMGDELRFSCLEESNDVIDAFRVGDGFGVLVEYFTDRQNWRSRIALSGRHIYPEVRGLSAPLPTPFNDAYSNFGHPSFTTGPEGKPKILFSFFLSHAPPFPLTDYSRAWRHEIWCWEPEVNMFNPRIYRRLIDAAMPRGAGEATSAIYDLLGAKKVLIQLTDIPTGGVVVTVEEATTVNNHIQGEFITTSWLLNAPGKIVVDNPLSSIRLKLSAPGPAVWIIAEY